MSDEQVRLLMPCTARFARVARTAAAACGVLEGFSVDELGDLRLLVDEVFVTLHELGADGVELVLTPAAGRLDVVMTGTGAAGSRRGAADTTFARTLAEVVGTDVRFELASARPSVAVTLLAAG